MNMLHITSNYSKTNYSYNYKITNYNYISDISKDTVSVRYCPSAVGTDTFIVSREII